MIVFTNRITCVEHQECSKYGSSSRLSGLKTLQMYEVLVHYNWIKDVKPFVNIVTTQKLSLHVVMYYTSNVQA